MVYFQHRLSRLMHRGTFQIRGEPWRSLPEFRNRRPFLRIHVQMGPYKRTSHFALNRVQKICVTGILGAYFRPLNRVQKICVTGILGAHFVRAKTQVKKLCNGHFGGTFCAGKNASKKIV